MSWIHESSDSSCTSMPYGSAYYDKNSVTSMPSTAETIWNISSESQRRFLSGDDDIQSSPDNNGTSVINDIQDKVYAKLKEIKNTIDDLINAKGKEYE